MEPKRYEVEVVCRRRMVYLVEAADPDEAQRLAAVRWGEGDEGHAVGGECWDLEEVRAAEVPAEQRGHVLVEPDRAAAVAAAVARAEPGDVVLVAGKGHEQGQDIAGAVRPFDDREVLRAAIEKDRKAS